MPHLAVLPCKNPLPAINNFQLSELMVTSTCLKGIVLLHIIGLMLPQRNKSHIKAVLTLKIRGVQ